MTPTCGTCQQWQVINVNPIAEGQPRETHVGRCRSGQVPGWARARRRADKPYRTTCHEPVAGEYQDYAAHAARTHPE